MRLLLKRMFSEEERKDNAFQRAKNNLKFKAKRAKFRYKDTIDYYNNEEAVSGNRKALKSWVENSKKRSGSNDSRQTIYHKNGIGPETIKDPEKYEFRKEETRRQEEGGQRAAEKALRKFDKERRHPKLTALKAAARSIKESAYSEKSPKLSQADDKKLSNLYNKWKKSGKQEDAVAYMDHWTKKVYVPNRKAGILCDPDSSIAMAAYDPEGYKRRQELNKKFEEQRGKEKKFSEEGKSNKTAREVGTVAGSLGVGALGGVGIHRLAKNSSKLVDLADKANDKIFFKPTGTKGARVARWKDGSKAMKLEEALRKGEDKMRPVTDKIAKFAKTKSGKWAIIGGTTAALGGAAYLEAKKKDKKK